MAAPAVRVARSLWWCAILAFVRVPAVFAQNVDELAKQVANPVSALISVPLQLNYDDGLGSQGEGRKWTLNIQPVIPFSISDHWNLLSRTILPIIGQHDVVDSDSSQSGIGALSPHMSKVRSPLKIMIEIIGWTAAVMMLSAYLLLTSGRLRSLSPTYQWLNVLSGAGFIVNSGWNGAYPSATLNLIWMAIGLYGLFRGARVPPATAR